MPRANTPAIGLSDTWGRANRRLLDRPCAHCGATFRPARDTARFCSRPCARTINGGHNFKGETWWVNQRGYVAGAIWIDGKRVYVRRHRWLMEQHLGRALRPTEDVHHIDGNKQNNELSNLQVLDHAAHSKLSSTQRIYRRGYRLNLTPEQRAARSERTKAQRARAAIALATDGLEGGK